MHKVLTHEAWQEVEMAMRVRYSVDWVAEPSWNEVDVNRWDGELGTHGIHFHERPRAVGVPSV